MDGIETNEVENDVVKPNITRLKANLPTGNVHEGDTITYTITAGNTGTESKTIDITDYAPEGTTFKEILTVGGEKVGDNGVKWTTTLNPGDSKEFKFTVTVNTLPNGTYGLDILNKATVDNVETNEVENDVVKPNITRLKANSPTENVHEGDTITYTITAGNTGTESKTIDIIDYAPEGTTFKEIITAGGEKVGDNGVKWTVTLNPGDSKTFQFSVTVNTLPDGIYGLNILNKATVDNVETNEVENNVVKPHIIEQSQKTSNPTSGTQVRYGNEITYTITVQNDGTEAQRVLISDNIPEYTEFVSVQDGGTTIVDGEGKVTQVQWTKEVPPKSGNTNGSVSVSFKVKVMGSADKTIINSATVDDTKTNETTHPIVTDVTVDASNNPGKNIVLILDLSSSMLKVPANTLSPSEYYYEGSVYEGDEYVYAKDLPGSVERPESNLAKAKTAIKQFAETILKDSNNKITLISFNYGSFYDATASILSEPTWYHTRYTDLMAHSEIHPYVGVNTLVETTNYNEFANAVDNIRIRAEYLLTNMVAGLEAAQNKVASLKLEGKDIDVVFFGDGKPSLPSEYGAKVGFYDETTTYNRLETAGKNIRGNGEANLYTLEYLFTESEVNTNIAKTAFQKMTGVSTQDNQIRFGANTSNVVEKLTQIASIIDAPISYTTVTNEDGIAKIQIPTGLDLRISDKAKVVLYIDKAEMGSYSSVEQINQSGKLTYNSSGRYFEIDTTKYANGSKIRLTYYYNK